MIAANAGEVPEQYSSDRAGAIEPEASRLPSVGKSSSLAIPVHITRGPEAISGYGFLGNPILHVQLYLDFTVAFLNLQYDAEMS